MNTTASTARIKAGTKHTARETIAPRPSRLRQARASLEDMVALATDLWEDVGVRELRSGRWFRKMVLTYLEHRKSHPDYPWTQAKPRETGKEINRMAVSDAIIRRACVEAALSGLGTAGVSTMATTLTASSEGVAGLYALPVAGLTIGVDMMLRALLHLKMTFDLADLFEVRFDPHNRADLAQLYAVAFQIEQHESTKDPGKDLVDRLTRLAGGDSGLGIGSRLATESILRNLLPFVNVATSSLGSWRLTSRVGYTVRNYVCYRHALDDAVKAVERECPEYIEHLIEGIWFVFICDGRLLHEEAALLAHLISGRKPELKEVILGRLLVDERDWINRLRAIQGTKARTLVFQGLEIAAAVDRSLPPSERVLLKHAARALHRRWDRSVLRDLIKELRQSGSVTVPLVPA